MGGTGTLQQLAAEHPAWCPSPPTASAVLPLESTGSSATPHHGSHHSFDHLRIDVLCVVVGVIVIVIVVIVTGLFVDLAATIECRCWLMAVRVTANLAATIASLQDAA